MAPDPLPSNLKRLRQAGGLTQQELAARIGKREKDISRWELGRNVPDLSSVRRIAAALGVSVDDLAPPVDRLDEELDAVLKRARRDTQR